MECDLSVLNKKIEILFICSARFASNYMEKCVKQKMIDMHFYDIDMYLPTRHCWTLSKSASHLRISTGGTLVSRSGLHSLDIQGSLTPFFAQQSNNKNNYYKLALSSEWYSKNVIRWISVIPLPRMSASTSDFGCASKRI